MTDVLTTFYVLCALSEYTRMIKWNIFALQLVLISVIPNKLKNVLKKFRSDDFRPLNLAAHFVICASVF